MTSFNTAVLGSSNLRSSNRELRSLKLSPQFLQRIDFSRFKTVYAKKTDTGAVQFYKDQVQSYIDSLPNTLVMIRVRGIQGRTKLFARSRPGTAPTPTPSTPHYGRHRIRFRGSNKVYGVDFSPQVYDNRVIGFKDGQLVLSPTMFYDVEVTTAAFDSTVNQIRLVQRDPYTVGKGHSADFFDNYGVLYAEYSPQITRTRAQDFNARSLEMTTFGTVSESSLYLRS